MNSAAQRVAGQHGSEEGKQSVANLDEEMAIEDPNDQRDESIPQELGGGNG